MLKAAIAAIGLVLAVSSPAFGQDAAQGTTGTGFRTTPDGDLVHEATGTHFPAKANGFTRATQIAFDKTGKNAVVVYERGSGADRSVARVALVQIDDMSALEHYAALAPVVGTYFRDLHFDNIRPISNGPLILAGVAPRNAWQGRFSALRDGHPYLLSLSTLDMGPWAGRITAAYPKARASDIQARLFALATTIRRTGPEHVHAAP